MLPDDRPPIEVNVNAMESLIDEALTILDKNWFARRISKDRVDRDSAKTRNHSRQRVRYSPKHPLVQWHVEYEAWRDAYTRENEVPLNQCALLLTTFASNLVKVKDAIGLEHILIRLREPDGFMATSFEVEVATGYVNRGWSVEFVETGAQRSPDLKVTIDDGKVFWAECKYREEMTGRDANILKFWEQLQDKIYRAWGPAKTNVAVILRSASDPVQIELDGISNAILQCAQILVNHAQRDALVMNGKSQDEKFEFTLQYLADPDKELPFNGFSGQGTDWFSWMGEQMHIGGSKVIVRNPKFFGFTNMNPSDKYAGVMNSFNSAVGQLPETGPGVIWIRVPYPIGDTRAQEDLDAMAAKLQAELSGTHNSRVNSVILSARVFSTATNEGRPALTYRHVSAPIVHKNPRHIM